MYEILRKKEKNLKDFYWNPKYSKIRGFLPAPPSISLAPPKISKIPKIPFDHLSEVT